LVRPFSRERSWTSVDADGCAKELDTIVLVFAAKIVAVFSCGDDFGLFTNFGPLFRIRTVRHGAVSATPAMIVKDKDALAWRGWFDQPKPALHAVEALVHAVKALVERHHWLDQYLKGPFEDPHALG
jgi:hypothetical protein